MIDIEETISQLTSDPELREQVRTLVATMRQEHTDAITRLDDHIVGNTEYANEVHASMRRCLSGLADLVGNDKVIEVFGEDALSPNLAFIDPSLMEGV